jgi:hypothetical protein
MPMHANADPKDGRQLRSHGGGDLTFCLNCQMNAQHPQCYCQVPSDNPGYKIVGCTGKVFVK